MCLCSAEHLETLIGWLQFLSPDGLGWDQAIRQVLQDSKHSFHSRMHSRDATHADAADGSSASTELFSVWWHLFTSSLLTLFLLSCVSHFAQYYQLLLDKEDSNQLRKRLPHATRLELSSPSTGRLKLPAPTPVLKMRRERERAKMSMMTSPNGSERKRRVDVGLSSDNGIEMEHDRLVSVGSAKKHQ
ncbi:hypothetical protein EON64_08115 [archaeon]|nr:MAG: hypothetical protein EON64_08115 [archaeon]